MCGAANEVILRSPSSPGSRKAALRLLLLKPSDRSFDALAVADGRLPAQPGACLGGAVFQVATE